RSGRGSMGRPVSATYQTRRPTSQQLGPYHCPIPPSRRPPRVIKIRGTRRERELRCQFLIDLDPEPRAVVCQHEAVLRFRTTAKHLARLGREVAPLVDAKVVARELERELRRMSKRRSIARPMPRRPDAAELAQRLHLARRGGHPN